MSRGIVNTMVGVAIISAWNPNKYFVASLSPPPPPPQLHQTIVVSVSVDETKTVDARAKQPPSKADASSKTNHLSYEYRVVDRCPVHDLLERNTNNSTSISTSSNATDGTEKALIDSSLDVIGALLAWNPNGVFPSKSQARRSLEFGRVLVFNATKNALESAEVAAFETTSQHDIPELQRQQQEQLNPLRLSLCELQNHHIAANTSVLDPHTTVLILVEPAFHADRYPWSVTKHLFPPYGDALVRTSVVYQDDFLAVVNKPENTTTIGGSGDRTDLQSVLGFLLAPSPLHPCYGPRPVHRLDRRTSGLVVVAKTRATMRELSRAFATRSVKKTYTALVFDRDPSLSSPLLSFFPNNYGDGDDSRFSAVAAAASADADADAENEIESRSETQTRIGTDPSWLVVDHPIEGKESLSHVRTVAVTPATSLGERIALVEVVPKTGRTHQIRRHLSYCLGMPIVGDSKYDGGARHLRTNGMYLCCHALRFPHDRGTGSAAAPSSSLGGETLVEWTNAEGKSEPQSELSIRISLPAKFHRWMHGENHSVL